MLISAFSIRPLFLMETGKSSLFFSTFALLASSGTLVCCALPIILVSVGLGSVLVALNVELTFLNSLAKYKIWIFLFSGGLLLISAWQLYAVRNLCPADPKLAASCKRIKKWSARLFISAALLWVIGFIAAYIALPVRMWLDS